MRTAVLVALFGLSLVARAQGQSSECDRKLTHLQREVIERFPEEVSSLETLHAKEDSPLFGYDLAHGYTILSGMGLTLAQFADSTKPELLFYWPTDAPSSEWLDFGGPDGPYELAGWGYIPELYPLSPNPPAWECIDAGDWFVHEAGWHLLDGGMIATPESRLEEPRRPSELDGSVLYWHPAGWDVHLWVRDGAPEIGLPDSTAPDGGLKLDDDLFWYPQNR